MVGLSLQALPVAIFVFLTASAGAGVVASDTFFGAYRFLARLLGGTWFRFVVARDFGLLGVIAAHVLTAFGLGLLDGDALACSFDSGSLTGSHGLFFLFSRLLAYGDLSAHQDGGSLAVHRVDHRFKQVVRLQFVDQQRVFVLVAGVLHGVAQFVHLAQVLLPSVVDGVQDGAYGFDNPTLVATLSYTTNSEEETGETDDNGEAVTETVETPHTFVLTVGAQADDDGYYATVEGSSKVYTVSQSDVESLLEASVDSLRDDSVCLMDWDTVDSIDITAGGQTKTLAITRTEETDDDGDTETVASYTLDGESLEDVDAEELLDAIDAFEAEGEGSASSAAEGSPELSFVFHRNTETFSEMTLSFTRYDNNFYLVSFNGEERLLVNRNAVADLTDMVSGW